MGTPLWGDDVDDSDDEQQQQPAAVVALGLSNKIPPTQTSWIDSKCFQIVTSYRANPSNHKQLLKTITKKFGQALIDEEESTKASVQSKDEVSLEDPNADTDLKEEEDTTAAFGNLNAFWAKQQRRQLQRKYNVDRSNVESEGTNAWTKVGGAAAAMGGKYVPPSMSGGAAGATAGMGFTPERRTDDLNTIRVTNLSESTTEADLQDLFARYGRISRVYLAKDKETMQSRGFAFVVSFVSKDDAAQAMVELQGYGYDHLILKLEWARLNAPKDPAEATEFRSGYGKALAQDTTQKVSYASNLTK